MVAAILLFGVEYGDDEGGVVTIGCMMVLAMVFIWLQRW